MIKLLKEFYNIYTNKNGENMTPYAFWIRIVLLPSIISIVIIFLIPKSLHEELKNNISNFLTLLGIVIGFVGTMLSIMISSYKLDDEKIKKIKEELGYKDPEKIISIFKKLLLLNTYISVFSLILGGILIIFGYYLYCNITSYISLFILGIGYYLIFIAINLLIKNFRAFVEYNNKIEI